MDQMDLAYKTWRSNLEYVNQLSKLFIVGSPKSGTTWLMKLLNSHPQIVVNGEGRFTWRLVPFLKQAFEAFNKDQQNNRIKELTQLRDFDIAMTCRALIDGQFSRYIEESKKPGQPLRVVGDKTPQHTLTMVPLKQIYPNAKFIHIVRDPRDAAVSAWFHFGKNSEKSQEEYFRHFIQEVWPTNVRAAMQTAKTLGDQYLEVRYEDLHTNEANVLQSCFQFLDVSDDAQTVQTCMHEASFKKLSGGRERGQTDANAFFRNGTIGDWVNHMTPELSYELCEPIETLMQKLGYESTKAPAPSVLPHPEIAISPYFTKNLAVQAA